MEKYSKDSLEKLSDILDLREADLHAEGATGSIDGILQNLFFCIHCFPLEFILS